VADATRPVGAVRSLPSLRGRPAPRVPARAGKTPSPPMLHWLAVAGPARMRPSFPGTAMHRRPPAPRDPLPAPVRPRAVGWAWVALALVGGHAPAAEPVAEPAATPWERIEVRTDSARRVLEAAVVTEAVDGGLLVELADQGYEILQPDAIVRRDAGVAAPPEAPRSLGLRVRAGLPAGFEVHVTRHYVFCHETSRDYARWCGALFERLYDAFLNVWRQAGLEVEDPPRPLIVVIFADRRGYEAHAAHDLGAAADRVAGYYNMLTNRVTTYDLTGGAGAAGGGAAADLVATLVHEATHQMAFNCGLHRRLAPVPVWVSEGMATWFETPAPETIHGWRGVGMVNRPRLTRYLQTHRPGDLEAIVRDDDRFRQPDTALDAYAAAWALTRHLLDTRKPAYAAYQRTLAAKQPFGADSPARRLADFEAAFGVPPSDLEADVLKTMARLASRLPRP